MKALITILALLGTFACQSSPTAPGFDAEKETAIVTKDIELISDAEFEGDAETLMNYAYPPRVEMLGAERLAAMYKNTALGQKRAGISRESLGLPSPPDFIEGRDGRWFVLVQLRTTIVSAKGGRGNVIRWYLGVKEPGAKEWKYIPSQLLNKDLIVSMFPDFPPDHPLPRSRNEKLPPREAASGETP